MMGFDGWNDLATASSAHARVLRITADAPAVRDVLSGLPAWPPFAALIADTRDVIELVLAEALNNIVEHAYVEASGPVLIGLDPIPKGLIVTIYDQGRPMPGGHLPEGQLRTHDSDGELAEGGFGWFLIRALTTALSYRRQGGANVLCLRFAGESDL